MAYAKLSAFERLAAEGAYAPTLADRLMLGELAVREYEHLELVMEFFNEAGVDMEVAMEPFIDSIDYFDESTKGTNWQESLMKAYVSDSIAADYFQMASAQASEQVKSLVIKVLDNSVSAQILKERLKQALAEDPRLGSRLALWARRLLGEALSLARRAILTVDVAGTPDEVQVMLNNHAARVQALGLVP